VNYYNEWDSFAAEWLKQLIKDGLIPDGEVDSRSIADVRPEDLKGFTQCHFFAGIGGWSRALQLAGWSPDRPVWTGSPPCQSFSTAGSRKGKDDERHLWPVFFNLIRECQPPTVFGEQVAAAIRFGWLDDLQDDFEAEGYASGAFVLPSGGIGAYHKRDRLFFTAKRVADSHNERHERSAGDGRQAQRGIKHSGSVSMAYSINERPQGRIQGREDSQREDINGHTGCSGSTDTLAYSKIGGRRQEQSDSRRSGTGVGSQKHETGGLESGNTIGRSSVGYSEHDGSHEAEIGRSTGSGEAKGGMLEPERSDSLFWGSSEVIYCRDGKHRPIPTEPALFPLAHGIPNRVGILRGAGNAIVPQAAAEIIKAVM
jgi:DNA (cytosine-5)-methyltransferase 1